MFNNSSHIDASHSTFSEVHRDQYYNTRSTIQGNQTINTVVHGNQIIQESHSNIIEALHRVSAPSATHDSAQRHLAPKCIEGTRTELLARLTSWIDQPDEKFICWLNGRPGSGKSAVSQTIAEKYAAEKRLAASFFFSRRDLERSTTHHVVSTLATQLFDFLPSIRPAIIAALEKDSILPSKVLREQMVKLLLQPLATATETPSTPLLIIIDALDECDDQSLVVELVSQLSLLPHTTSISWRLLITSRSEPWLQSQFHKTDISSLTLSLDIHDFSSEGDIRSFLRHALDETYHQHLSIMADVPHPWPSSDELEHIISKADGLFIFASTVVKFVGDGMHNPVERLQVILGDKSLVSTRSAYADLDTLYLDAISTFPDRDVARLVLGIVYCMAIPLSVSSLHKLLQRPDVDARIVVPALSSVLLASDDGSQPVQFYHASFRDFLIDPQRSRMFTIDPSVYHGLMTQLCLETMSNGLKRDMCGIEDPSKANRDVPDLAERRNTAFDEALLYACRFWSRHLVQVPTDGTAVEGLLGALKKFSTTVLLHWIEARSLFGELEGAVVMLRDGIRWVKTLGQLPQDVFLLLEGAEQLVVLFMDCISEYALHTYRSAILLAFGYSTLQETFDQQSIGRVILHPVLGGDLNAHRMSFNIFHPIHSVTFSPNDDVVATAGTEHGVQVWNVITGRNVASFGDHSSTSLLVRFSPSGAFLAAAFEGGTVIVWDPKTGREHLKHEACHAEPITCLEFSANSVLLASGSRDRAIYVWSMQIDQPMYHLTTHEGPVTSLVFSSDSVWLVSGSEDHLVIVWDMSTGKLARGMTGHRMAVNCIAVSADGRAIASGSEDKSIKIWDMKSGNCMRSFSGGHRTGIRSVHFFDEDKHVIAACDETIISWDVTSRHTSSTIWSGDKFIKTVLKHLPMWRFHAIGWGVPTPLFRFIIPDSIPRHLVAAYATKSPSFAFTNLGFLFSGSLPAPVTAMPVSVTVENTVVAISSDGSWTASTDPRGALRIHDLTMRLKTWEDLEDTAKSNPLSFASYFAASPDGTRFVLGSFSQWSLIDADYKIIRKIDMGFLEQLRNTDDIWCKFSEDGSIFLCVIPGFIHDDKSTIRIFDSVTGEQRAHIKKLKKAHSFTTSANGAWVACGHGSGHLEVFRVASAERASLSEPGNSPITVLAFSEDAKELVSGSDAGVVRVWDRASGICKATLEISPSTVTALAYAGALGAARVAIGRADGSLCLWSPTTSTSHDILRSDQATVKKVDFIRFSDDQSELTSRADDGAVFVWTIAFDADDTSMARCALCLPKSDADDASHLPPHLVSQIDADDAVDSLFHTTYRVRKDGWLVKGDDQRVVWFPPSIRPRGKDAFFAYENGQVVFFMPTSGCPFFLKFVDD